MDIRNNELKIFYKGEFDQLLDNAIEKVLNKYGYRRLASSYSFEDHIRNLCFTKEPKQEIN